MFKLALPGLAAALLLSSAASAVVFPTAVTPVAVGSAGYTQDFSTLASTGTAGTTLPAGWQVREDGGNTAYTVSDGSSNAGGAYSFGTVGSADRALGSLGSGSVAPIYYGGFFTNGLAATVTSIAISYAGEQWRRTNSTDDGLFFEYSLNSTDLSGGTWIAATALDFAPLQTGTTAAAIDGNNAANRRLISGSLSNLAIASGAGFAIRWRDENSNGSLGDQGLGIDDVALTLTPAVAAVPEVGTWLMMIAGFALVGSAARRRRAVSVTA